MRSLELRDLLTIEVSARPPVVLGADRRCVPFAGGTFAGRDGLAGTLLDGGCDWQLVRPDGVLEIDARYGLRTTAGDDIEVRSTGIRKAAPEVAERIAAGAPVGPDEYYFRTHIRLSTTAPGLAWMNDLIAVSTGQRGRDVVRIEVHEVC